MKACRVLKDMTCQRSGAVLALALAASAPAAAQAPVQVQMRNVAFHFDTTVVLRLAYLRGRLRRKATDQPAFLDDKYSFTLVIDTARAAITPAALTDLLNRYTFAYPGSPLRKLSIGIQDARLKLSGLLHGISFSVRGDLTLTPEGELRLHPSSIKAIGIGVTGLLKLFGVHLQKMVRTDRARGVRVEGNDLLLAPAELLPPPAIEGHVTRVEVNDSEIVQVFRPDSGSTARELTLPRADTPNYMFFRGGVLRFGKLMMNDTDLLIVDAEPKDPFDFFLDRYNQQLVAGYSRNTTDHGLIVTMPDFRRTAAPARAR